MSVGYKVGIVNRFAMLEGDGEDFGDPQDIEKLVKAEKAKKTLKAVSDIKEIRVNKPSKAPVDDKPEKKPVITKPEKNEDGEDMETVKNRRNREDKVNNKARNGDADRSLAPPRRREDRREGEGDNRPRKDRRDFRDHFDEGRGDRRALQNKRPPPPPNSNRKREFDRKSGSDKTGVKAVEKREGGGAHNWGTIKDDLTPPTLNSEAVSGDENEHGDRPDPDTTTEKKDDAPVELTEEVKEITLDEYKALRGKRQQPHYNLRRAGEGEDQSQWKGLIVLENKKKATGSEDDEELEKIECPQRVGRQKHLLDIDIAFKTPRKMGNRPTQGQRDNRDNRERKDDTDRRPTGPRRQQNGIRESETGNPRGTDAAAPRVDDEKAFPSLG